MNLKNIEDQLKYEALNHKWEDSTVSDGYTSDLLSDVMGNAPDDSVLITIQGHKNTLAVASLAGIKGIILCNNRKAPEDMIDAADKEGIAIFTTPDNQFTASWKVAALLGKSAE